MRAHKTHCCALCPTPSHSGKVPSAFTLDNFKSDEAKKEFNEVTKAKAVAQVAKYEKWLLPAKDRFTQSGQTVVEIDLFCKLYMLKASLPELSSGAMGAFYTRMEALPGIKKVLDGGSKMGVLHDYLVAMP